LLSKLMGRQTQISPMIISRLKKNRALNCEKALRQLGYSITPFTEGMRKTIHHLQNYSYA
jgi:hypothetical protein